MSYKTISTYVDVDVSLDDWEDDELIDELEGRGYNVNKDENHPDISEVKDDIHALYIEWLDDQGDRDNRFEKAVRKFFEKYMNKVSV